LGHVGAHLARLLTDAGAELTVADTDARKVEAARAELGATAAPADEILTADVDVVCPCAEGGVVTEAVVDRLKARYLIGAANNMLADPGLAGALGVRGVTHVPDFVANAGGLIACEAEIRGSDDGLLTRVERIGVTTEEVLRAARRTGCDELTVAHHLAADRLAARRASRPYFATARPPHNDQQVRTAVRGGQPQQ
jgi:leucine dehydrogenase